MGLNIETQSKEAKYKKMTENSVPKLVTEFAVPAMIIMVITSVYNVVNAYFVGKLGTAQAGAVQLVFPVLIISQAIGLFFAQGAGNYISRAMGAKDIRQASHMASTGFYYTVMIGILLAVLGTVFLEPLSKMLGAQGEALEYTMDFLLYIMWSMPFMTSSLVLNSILRFQGNAVLGMVGIVIGAVFCAVLDPILIMWMGLGVSGASLATLLSQLLTFIILVIGCVKAGGVTIKLKDFSFSPYYMKEMARSGLPSLLKQGLTAVASFLMNKMAFKYGISAVASVGFVQNISIFANSAIAGLGQGLQPVCGFNYGAKKYDRVKHSFMFSIKFATGIMVVFSVAGFIFAPQLIRFFRDDPEVIAIGSFMLRAQCLTYSLIPLTTVGSMFLQTLGKATKASLLSVARQGLFLIPALLILTYTNGLRGFQISQPISDFFAFLLALYFIRSIFKEMDSAKTQDNA